MKRKEMLQGSLPLYSTKIALSVVDNVLVIHQVDAKVVMLEDIFADSRTRVSAPLPLLIRGLPRGTNVPSSAESSEASTLSNDTSAANLYSDDWSFLVPDLVCDVATGFLWKIKLDLEAISASSSEVTWVLEFLQRRKLEANKAKHLCVELLGSIVIERRPLPVIFRAVNVLVSSFAYSLKIGSYSKSGKPRAENSNNQDTTVKTQASSNSEGNANSSNGENLMASEDQQLNGSGSESQVTSAAGVNEPVFQTRASKGRTPAQDKGGAGTSRTSAPSKFRLIDEVDEEDFGLSGNEVEDEDWEFGLDDDLSDD